MNQQDSLGPLTDVDTPPAPSSPHVSPVRRGAAFWGAEAAARGRWGG
jgi:hypothetical protein